MSTTRGYNCPIKARRRRIWIEQNEQCFYCLDNLLEEEITIDHIIPKSICISKYGNRNGTSINGKRNFVVACSSCNSARGKMPFTTFVDMLKSKSKPRLKQHIRCWERRRKNTR